MPKDEDVLNSCGHRNSERVKALKEFPSSICPACLRERIKELEDELEQHRWIPVSERLPEQKYNSYCSDWVVTTDKKTWTIAQYNYEYAHWDTDHSPYDLGMEEITHWKPIILPGKDK